MILKCPSACAGKAHSQDELHGNGVRVFNETPKKDDKTRFVLKCTVCGFTFEKSIKE
jgi:hypothetical protein